MKNTLYVVLFLLLFVGCKKDKPLPEPVIDNIEMDKDCYELDYKEQILTLEFLATNAQQRFEIGADWITLIEDSRAAKSYSQSFAVSENESSDMRSTYIKIFVGDVEYRVVVEQAARPEMLHLMIRHNTKHLYSPLWEGSNLRGSIDWGDGIREEYDEGIDHYYSSDAKYDARFEMENATGFRIEQLGNLEHLEIAF